MTQAINFPGKLWKMEHGILLAFACLALGIAGGWWTREWRLASQAKTPVAAIGSGTNGAAPVTSLKQMADAQAAPLAAKLKADPNNADLLIGIGNVYYDAQQYAVAVDFYGRALSSRPSDAAVRTDMATAYWYLGKSDTAIAEFNKALTYAPDNPNTLLNLGVVELRGKNDPAAAMAHWNKLLAANPNYPEKDKVQQMLAEARKSANAKP